VAISRRGQHHACMRRHYTKKQRSGVVDLVNSGRATVSEAAARLGVTPSTAYYWMRARRAGATPASKVGRPAEPKFVRLVRSSEIDAAISVRVGNAEIQVRREFDADLLRAVVEALRGDAV
jgi:transposase-like protein